MKVISVLLSLCLASSVLADEVKSNLSDPGTLEKILSEALDMGVMELRGKKGEELIYALNSQTPYTGWVKMTYENGQVKWLEQAKNGKRQLRADWHEKGMRAWEGNYKGDNIHGLEREWYENGQKKVEVYWNDGLIVTASSWLPDGSKCPLTNIKDGNGLSVTYHENGKKEWETHYRDGKQHGLNTQWLLNGQKWTEDNYKDGKRHGPFTRWDEEGKVKSQTMWENGVMVEKNEVARPT
jgi:antitoxin component YwqK of YwqJK toxin-antitoxin module